MSAMTRVAVLAAVVFACGPTAFGDESKMRTMRIRVATEGGAPLAEANIHVRVWSPTLFGASSDYLTNDKGEARIERPYEVRSLRIWSSKPGYASMFAQWRSNRDDPAAPPIPDEVTFSMPKGVEIGGTVEDERGRPIEDVTVGVRLVDHGEDEIARRRIYSDWLATGEDPSSARKTDAQGFWMLDNAPPHDDIELSFWLQHPDYILAPPWDDLRLDRAVTLKSLREKNLLIVMKKGIRISGKVVGSGGKPIRNAVVIMGHYPGSVWGSQEVLSDENGVYRLPASAPGEAVVTVVAPDWAPALQRLHLAPGNDRADFELQAGKLLRLKFVDVDTGAALSGVTAFIKGWRGAASLYNHRDPNVIDAKIPFAADDNGIYEWPWAPEDKVSYTFYKEGYKERDSNRIANGEEQIVKLSPAIEP
jgi:hypothetical protein